MVKREFILILKNHTKPRPECTYNLFKVCIYKFIPLQAGKFTSKKEECRYELQTGNSKALAFLFCTLKSEQLKTVTDGQRNTWGMMFTVNLIT